MCGEAERKMPAQEPAGDAASAATSTPQTLTVVWVYDGPVCVNIIDSPAPVLHDGVCHCPACHGAFLADWGKLFD